MTNHWDLMFIAIIAVTMSMVNSATTAQNTCTDSQRLEGPIIEPCQSEIILQKGQNYTLTCKAKFAVGFIQQDISQEITTINMKQRNESITEGEYKYKMVLELYNVDQYTVGYYACYDEKINMSIILKNLTEEPVNTPSVSFIYIYVNGTDFLFAPMRQVITPRNRFLAVIECKPTAPDVQVSLKESRRNKNPDSVTFSPKIGFILGTCSRIGYTCIGQLGKNIERIRIPIDTPPPTPRISGRNEYFLEGENFSINCTITYMGNVLVNLKWEYPPNTDNSSILVHTNENEVMETGLKLFKNITIINATKEHGGTYKCISTNNCDEKTVSFRKTFMEEATLELYTDKVQPVTSTQPKYTLNIEIDAYPEPSFYFTKNGVRLPSENNSKYRVYKKSSTGDAMLFINSTEVTDSANYTLVADNGYLKKNITVDIRFKGPPKITFGSNADKKYVENMRVTLRCDVIAWPFPDVDWIFSYGEKEQILPSATIEALSVYKASATLVFPRIHASGNITCRASNEWGTQNVTRRLIVYEVDGGFGIKNRDNTWFPQNQDVTMICVASKFDFSSVDWIGVKEENLTAMVEQTENPLSLVAKLKIPRISLTQSGEYTCRGVRYDGNEAVEPINISVEATRSPVISDPLTDVTEEVYRKQKIQLTCLADGVPAPTIEWSKDAVIFKNDSNVEILTTTFNRTFVNSTIKFEVNDNYTGTYECLASSEGAIARRTYTLVSGQSTYVTYLSVIIVIVLILIVLVIYLTIKIRKEKAFRRELAAAGLLYFKEGITKSLNPDLGIDEQAELLPYDDKFEFPAERLILGKQLGAGAFGVVYKAEARGIINAEETTEVAVKMVKKTADNMYIKALASELKIMVHLGKHINIVNLLGACTKNVGKRELSVIVEYCKFGNIHNYMQRHREVFIDQLTDNKEKNLGRVNRGFSCSSGSTGAHSDYFGACNTQETDHTFVNSANTNRSARKISEGYVQPEWRSNYESDYSFDGRNPRPLTSRDLLAWAFQIARGMEYLASRKVLHGDLAARNVLLAEDNIVKICDFGLARSIYKNDEYQKKENSLLPVKWLAIECMTDRIFSTQSDVWSFGIVLWELFTLAKTPYPNMDPAHLLRWLSEGNRLAKPTYADDKIYDVMLRCWEQKPTTRPSFSQLQEIIGGFLEDNVRNHYVDLNTAYIDMNATPSGYEDYLIMMNAPDYNNLVTPSPHHYVNDVRNFFPTTPTELDEEGYLKMNTRQNIFSPRPEDSKFDFDVRKFNPKESEASSCGSELTPMLTLNNLPARGGSESDHEGSASPNITMCPTIDEETDEVFEMKNRNAKNVMINTAVSNPTYITMDVDIEKKPKDIINSYMNVPNGLVK